MHDIVVQHDLNELKGFEPGGSKGVSLPIWIQAWSPRLYYPSVSPGECESHWESGTLHTDHGLDGSPATDGGHHKSVELFSSECCFTATVPERCRLISATAAALNGFCDLLEELVQFASICLELGDIRRYTYHEMPRKEQCLVQFRWNQSDPFVSTEILPFPRAT